MGLGDALSLFNKTGIYFYVKIDNKEYWIILNLD